MLLPKTHLPNTIAKSGTVVLFHKRAKVFPKCADKCYVSNMKEHTMKLDYSNTIRTWDLGGTTVEIKTTMTKTFWAVFKNGQKITDFMNCKGSCAPTLVRAELAKLGINY